MLEFFWWGSVFLLALPVMAALLILGPCVLPEYRDPNAGRLDIVSAAMSVAAVLACIFGLKDLAQSGLSATPIMAIVARLAITALWVRRQQRLDDPMIDLSLFRIRAFNTALAVNFLAIFVAIGYFLFVAQYLQLVSGLSPLEAGLWSLPSAIAFVIGSQLAPRIVQRIAAAHLISGGLGVAAVGLLMLTRVGPADGLSMLIISSVVISAGLVPVFGLTTELVVGSAPPSGQERPRGSPRPQPSLAGRWGLPFSGASA